VDLMFHRIAISEQYRDSPTAVRVRWAFRDFLSAHVILDLVDEERARIAAEAASG
jgi:pyridoxal biosynthesis lyase PdxS